MGIPAPTSLDPVSTSVTPGGSASADHWLLSGNLKFPLTVQSLMYDESAERLHLIALADWDRWGSRRMWHYTQRVQCEAKQYRAEPTVAESSASSGWQLSSVMSQRYNYVKVVCLDDAFYAFGKDADEPELGGTVYAPAFAHLLQT
jgi:hypothetical protein